MEEAMKRIAIALLFLAFSFGFRADAQEGLQAELLWFGTYTSGEVKAIDDPTSPTGKKHVSTGIKGPAANSDRIAIVRGETSFGFGYRLTGTQQRTVRIIHIFRFPGKGIPDKNGRLQESTTVSDQDDVGQPAHIGWRMNGLEPKEYEGVWTLQVWSEQRLLLERKFTLYRP